MSCAFWLWIHRKRWHTGLMLLFANIIVTCGISIGLFTHWTGRYRKSIYLPTRLLPWRPAESGIFPIRWCCLRWWRRRSKALSSSSASPPRPRLRRRCRSYHRRCYSCSRLHRPSNPINERIISRQNYRRTAGWRSSLSKLSKARRVLDRFEPLSSRYTIATLKFCNWNVWDPRRTDEGFVPACIYHVYGGQPAITHTTYCRQRRPGADCWPI